MYLWQWKWYWTLVGFDYSFFNDMHRLKFNFSYRNMGFFFQSKSWFPKDILLIQHLLVGLDTQTVSFVSCAKSILKMVGQGLFKCVTSEAQRAYKGLVLMVALFVVLVSEKLVKQSVSNDNYYLSLCVGQK